MVQSTAATQDSPSITFANFGRTGAIEREVSPRQVGEGQPAEQRQIHGRADQVLEKAPHDTRDVAERLEPLGPQVGAMRGARAAEEAVGRSKHEEPRYNTGRLTGTPGPCYRALLF